MSSSSNDSPPTRSRRITPGVTTGTIGQPYATPERGFMAAVLAQAGIRLKYGVNSWAGTKPWLLRSLSGHPAHGASAEAPELRATTALGIKLAWTIAGLFRIHPLGSALYRYSGLRSAVVALHDSLYRDVVRTWAERPPTPRQTPLPEFDWRTRPAAEFMAEFVQRPHPVVLRGFAEDTAAARNWSFEWLLERYGDEPVLLTTSELDGEPGELREVEDPQVYLHNSEALFRRHLELIDDLELARLVPYCGMQPTHLQLFLGRKGTGTPFHAAANWNWFFNVEGRKTWWFVAPRHSYLLYPVAMLGQAAAFALCPYPDDYDRDFFPAFEHCPVYEVTLEPGDVLFNPPWWWHAIRNDSDRTLGVASRWMHGGQVGTGLNMIEQDYDIDRMRSWMFFAGPASVAFLHRVLRQPSPPAAEGTTLRERTVRFGHLQRKMSREVVFGARHRF